MSKIYDAIIIGAGPSGVTAAHLLSGKGLDVLVLEKGKDLLRRKDLICGWFGRGLYGMNRLKIEDPALRNKKVFKEAIVILKNLTGIKEDPLEGQYWEPSQKIGRMVAQYFYDSVSEKADIKFNTEVQVINPERDVVVIGTDKGLFKARRCIIATGKHSIEWVQNTCKILGIKCEDYEVQIGVRVEMPANIMNKVVDNCNDVQISDSEAKCSDLCTNSFVAEWEDSGILSAVGCPIPSKKSNSTNFMVDVKPGIDGEKVINAVKIINILANDKIRRERVSDYMEKRSVLQDLDVFESLDRAFLELSDVIPSFFNYALMYIPEVKLPGVLPVNAKMKTRISNLYAIGECTTRTTTIIGAMASGLIVARTILGE